MNLYSEEILKKEFSDKVSKKAYLDLCKWLAINVYSKDEFAKFLTVNVEKKKSKLPTFILTIYVSFDVDKVNERHCTNCKYLTSTFYQIEKPNCNYCKFKAYLKRIEKEIKGMKDFYEKTIED